MYATMELVPGAVSPDALMARTQYGMMTVSQVAQFLGISRGMADELEVEILPYVNLAATGRRQLKRYHPLDVAAAEVFVLAASTPTLML